VSKLSFKALVGDGVIANQKVLLVKPQTYMNLSGESVRQVVQYYKIAPENLLVIYDDVDIETGKIRIRKKGSAGSHNGMKSIIYQIQSDEFPRVRIGIGGERRLSLRDFVTGGFSKEEKPLLEDAVQRSVGAIESIIAEGVDRAMNRYNG
jgi:PTH1 family peptidyl-tRNA hydrolase